jgi:hypothetical protein
MSVVDGKLKAYGIECLRIADGSITPGTLWRHAPSSVYVPQKSSTPSTCAGGHD